MENFELIKYGLIFIGIALILLVLFISYKTDNSQLDMVEEDDEKDDDYDNIETDEEQSLYSSFDEEELAKEELDLSKYNSETEQMNKNVVDTNNLTDDHTINTEVNEIPNDFEFDAIMNEPIKNNILEDMYDKNIENNENKETINYKNSFEYDENFMNQMNENLSNQNNMSDMDNISLENRENEGVFGTSDYSNNDFLSNAENNIDIFSDTNDAKVDYFEEPVQNQYFEETDTFFTQEEPSEEFVDEISQYQTSNFNEEDSTEFFTISDDNIEIDNNKEEMEAIEKTIKRTTKKTEDEQTEKKSDKKTTKKSTTKKTEKETKNEEKTAKKSTEKKNTTRKSTKKSEDKEKPTKKSEDKEKPTKKSAEKKTTTRKSTKKSEDEEKTTPKTATKKTTTKKTTKKLEESKEGKASTKKKTTRKKKEE